LSADWNDCLKLGYRGESVFVAFQLRLALKTYAEISSSLALSGERLWAETELAALDAKIDNVCWDGEWFIWAIAEDGTVFGTKGYPEGQVYLNTQAWAVISGAASKDHAARALATVRERLASKWGVAMCAPPFKKTPVDVMRAVLFNPGNKENGGIFSHTQSWAVLAEVLAGDPEVAWRYYRAFLPSAQNDTADTREIEPYVHCQSTYSQFSEKFGRSRVPWLSGTASWAHFTAANHLLGIRPEPGGLRIDPCIPKDWPGFTAIRKIRGMTIHIKVLNPDGRSREVKTVEVDGTVQTENLVPMEDLHDGSCIIVCL
jgi:cellobiose phosphorylase